MFSTWIKRWWNQRMQSATGRRIAGSHGSRWPRRITLFLEPLEERTLLTAWTPVGAGAVTTPAGYQIAQNSVSGRVTAIAADPNHANILYVATAGGGIWKTTTADPGNITPNPNWTPETDQILKTTDTIGAIAVAPSNSNFLYAGTGEANNSGDSNYGEGILVSTNGGTRWQLENPSGEFNGLAVSKIVVDPNNFDIAYAAVTFPGENGNYPHSTGNTGIYETTNGGQNWSNITTTLTLPGGVTVPFPAHQYFSDVALNPTTGAVYAAVGNPGGSVNNGIYEGTYSSTARAWTWMLMTGAGSGFTPPNATGRISLAIAPSTPSTMWVLVSANNGTLDGPGVWESTDGGVRWSSPHIPAFPDATNLVGSQGNYDLSLAVSPSNCNTIFVGGSTTPPNLATPNVFQGEVYEWNVSNPMWTPLIQDGTGNGVHADIHALTFDANGHLLVGSDGGIFRMNPNPTPANPNNFNWANLNGNLSTIQFYSIAVNPTNPNIVIGGSQDNGIDLLTGGAAGAWNQTVTGDGHQVAFATNTLAYASEYVQAIQILPPPAPPTLVFFFYDSINGGTTWVQQPAPVATPVAPGSTNQFPPFAVNPNNTNEVFFGTNNLYEGLTNAAGVVNWGIPAGSPLGTVAPPITAIGVNGWNPAGNPVDSIAVSGDGNTIYAATGGTFAAASQIFVGTRNPVTNTWTWVPHAGSQPTGHVNQIIVNPANPQQAYAVVNRFAPGRGGHVFVTNNGGATWQDISGRFGLGLPNSPTWTIQVNWANHTLYVGTDQGVYYSTTNGLIWRKFGTNLPNAQVYSLVYDAAAHMLFAGTHGRGVWEITA